MKMRELKHGRKNWKKMAKIETSAEEQEITHELELTESNRVPVEQIDLVDEEFVTCSDVQLMIAREVKKRINTSTREGIIQAVEDLLIHEFHVGYNAPKE